MHLPWVGVGLHSRRSIWEKLDIMNHLFRISAGEINFTAVNNAYDAAYDLQVGPFNLFQLLRISSLFRS